MRPYSDILFVLHADVAGLPDDPPQNGDRPPAEVDRDRVETLRAVAASTEGELLDFAGATVTVAFAKGPDAVGCAVAMQEALVGPQRRGEAPDLQLRVGIHAGEVSRDGATTYGEPTVARRLCEQATPGQILTTELVRGLVGSRGGFEFRDAGPLALKGLAMPLTAKEVVWSAAPAPPRQSRVKPAPRLKALSETALGYLEPAPAVDRRVPLPWVVGASVAGLLLTIAVVFALSRSGGNESSKAASEFKPLPAAPAAAAAGDGSATAGGLSLRHVQQLAPASVPGPPADGRVPHRFAVAGLPALSSSDLQRLLTVTPSVTPNGQPFGTRLDGSPPSSLVIWVPAGTASGTYQLTLRLPEGQSVIASFQHSAP